VDKGTDLGESPIPFLRESVETKTDVATSPIKVTQGRGNESSMEESKIGSSVALLEQIRQMSTETVKKDKSTEIIK